MTDHEKALADLLQLSLFKWAEAMHDALKVKRENFPERAEECGYHAITVEKYVDSMIEQHCGVGSERIMETIDNLHRMITSL